MTTNTDAQAGSLPTVARSAKVGNESGFSLVELLVATTLLLMISAIVTQALLQMTKAQATIWNRTEMHSGIRGATELLQQEVGQAGRISLPGATVAGHPILLKLNGALNAPAASCDPGAPATGAVTIPVFFKDVTDDSTVTSVAAIVPATGVYGTVHPLSFIYASAGPPAAYELLTTMDGANSETIKVATVSTGGSSIDACYVKTHATGTVLMPMGGFANGIIPDSGVTDPSTGTKLKLFGDINSDGNLVYIEYNCDTVNHVLTRYVMPYNMAAANKDTTKAQVLLANIVPNPPLAAPPPCFVYQSTSMLVQGTTFTFVLDVAVTLTVESEQIDPITQKKQQETKALLNVSPRNIFNAWELASIGYTDRIQSTPSTVTALLP